MILRHPTTGSKIRLKRQDYDLRAQLVREGYKEVVPARSQLKERNAKLFVALGTSVRARACLRMLLDQPETNLNFFEKQAIINAVTAISQLEERLKQSMRAPLNQTAGPP